MNKTKIEDIVRNAILENDKSTLIDTYLLDVRGLNDIEHSAAERIFNLVDEEDDLKTVLPDMSGVTDTKIHVFSTKTGHFAYYWTQGDWDSDNWKYGAGKWKNEDEFISTYPNLGTLHEIDS